jgi:small subunit ribosomal protein S8
MSLNDPLSNVLSKMLNADKVGKKECSTKISSKLILNVLEIMKDNGYIGEFKEIKEENKGRLTINLLGKINKCGSIKPRFSIKVKDIEKYEKRYLPAKDFGIIIISTNKGLITHKEAKKQGNGGRLLSYVY